MQNTTHGYPYPLGTDFVRDGDDVIGALAQALDPAPTTLTITAAAGWTAGSGRVLRIGPLVYWSVGMTRTGAAIVTDSTGNTTDVPVFTGLPANLRPDPTVARVRCIKSDNHDLYGYVDNTGACYFTHGWPSQTYAATSGYQLIAQYFLGF